MRKLGSPVLNASKADATEDSIQIQQLVELLKQRTVNFSYMKIAQRVGRFFERLPKPRCQRLVRWLLGSRIEPDRNM